MDIGALYELKNRLNACAVAGVGLIGEDFRLKRAVEQVKPLAAASPVFARISEMAGALLTPGAEHVTDQLLDTLALLDAVLCTQGAVKAEGTVSPIKLAGGTACSPRPYSVLEPVLTALTGTGGGRYRVVCDAMESTPDLLRDYRLRAALVDALGDSYSDLADKAEEILSGEEAGLAPLLKKGFDPMGKKAMERRVRVMGRVAGAMENGWYLSMLEQPCAPAVRCALLEELRYDQGNAEKLLEFVKTEKGNAKKAALQALAYMNTPEAEAFFVGRLEKKPESVSEFLNVSRSDMISDIVAEKLDAFLEKMLDTRCLSDEDTAAFYSWLDLATYKTSKKMLDFFRKAEESAVQLGKLKRMGGERKIERIFKRSQEPQPVCEAIGTVLAETVEYTRDAEFVHMALSSWQKHPTAVTAGAALFAGLLTLPAKEAYEALGRPAENITKLSRSAWEDGGWRIFWYKMERVRLRDNRYGIASGSVFSPLADRLDRRWFDLLTNPQIARSKAETNYRYHYDMLAYQLADLTDPALCRTLADRFLEHARQRPDSVYFDYLILLGERNFTGLIAPYAASKNNYVTRDTLIRLLLQSSLTQEEMAREVRSLADLCKKERRERICVYLTAADVEDMARQMESGVPPDKLTWNE